MQVGFCGKMFWKDDLSAHFQLCIISLYGGTVIMHGDARGFVYFRVLIPMLTQYHTLPKKVLFSERDIVVHIIV
jgi:hypothetical protein